MAEEQNVNPGASAEETPAPQFLIHKLYVKDVSFELPNAPEIFQEQGQSDVKMSLANGLMILASPAEVLTVTVTATLGKQPISPK
jgi:preprotein translocase subunit SecB